MLVNELLYVAVVPLLVAAAVALILRRFRSPPRAVWAVGVGLGYVAGQYGLTSPAGAGRAFSSLVWPHEARDWLPLGVLLAMGITIFAAYAPRAWRRRIIGLGVLLAIGVPMRLLAGNVAQQLSLLEKLLHLVLLAATLGLAWLLLASARDDDQPRVRAVLLVLAAVGAAVVAVMSGAIINGELCGVVAAALTGTGLAALMAGPDGATGLASGRRGYSLAEPVARISGLSGAAGVVTISLCGLIILGVYYANLTPANAALLFLSVVAAAGRLPDVVYSRPAWQQAAIRAALCLVPLAIAIAGSTGSE